MSNTTIIWLAGLTGAVVGMWLASIWTSWRALKAAQEDAEREHAKLIAALAIQQKQDPPWAPGISTQEHEVIES